MADLIENQVTDDSDELSQAAKEYGISEAEYAKIQARIETIVVDSIEPEPLAKEFSRPRRSGRTFPLLLNLAAAAIVAGGIFGLSWYFDSQKENITLDSVSYFSAEAQLIEEILRESEEQLAAKDQEIGQIQNQLNQLDQEKRNLEANIEAEVENREAQLRDELAAELQAERERLAGEGQTEDQITARLQAIQDEREAEHAAELDNVRAEADAELAARQAELDQQQQALEQTLTASRQDRERLIQEAETREAELRAELTAEIETAQEAEREALAQITALQAAQEQESLLTDQILGSFAIIVQDIQEGLTEDAIDGLDSLQNLLLDEAGGTSERERRRRTEVALVGTLRSLVREVDVLRQNLTIRDLATTEEQTANLEQQRAAELIQTAAEVVQLAESARAAGRADEARSLYQQALATIPSLEAVYPGILDLESSRRQIIVESAIGEAATLLASGGSDAAVTTYLQALREIAADQDDPILAMADGIADAVAGTEDDLLAMQQDIEVEHNADLASKDQQIASLNQQLSAARNTATNLQTALDQAERDVAGIDDEIVSLQAEIDDTQSELAQSEADLRSADAEIEQLKTSLAAEESRAASLQESLEQIQGATTDLESQEQELSDQLATARTERDTAQTQLERVQADLTTAQAEAAQLQSDLGLAEVALAESQAETATAKAEAADAVATAVAAAEARSAAEAVAQTDAEAAAQATADAEAAEDAQQEAARAQEEATLARITQAREEVAAEAKVTIDALESQVEQLDSRVATLDQQVTDLESARDVAQEAARSAQGQVTSLQADLDAANQTTDRMQNQLESVQESRGEESANASELERQITSLNRQVDSLEADVADIEALKSRYATQLSRAQTQLERGNYELARSNLTSPFTSGSGSEFFPGFGSTMLDIYSGIIAEAESEAGGSSRTDAFDDVVSLARAIQQNTDAPRSSATVKSLVNRNPDMTDVADEIFEIVELASRSISAPELEYRLLGSVSRVTGNLIVVERLVALDVQVGDQVEMRRSPQLGQETPIASGSVLEVTDRRVVVSIVETYDLNILPTTQDLVYLGQE